MKHGESTIRKAAILLSSLDTAAADKLLDQMPAEQASRLRLAMAELDDIDPIEQRAVAEEFCRVNPLAPAKHPPGIELDGSFAIRASARVQTGGVELELSDAVPPAFQSLHQANGRELAPFLKREHPQTIAVVVSHLPADRAAEVLSTLAPALQADVARRLVDLEQADPEILREVERELETWLSEQARVQQRRSAGLSALRSILDVAAPTVQHDILANLTHFDRQLADRIAPGASIARATERVEPRFEDVEQLNDVGLAELLRKADSEVVLLALAGASSRLVDRILRQLPPRDARKVRRAMDHLGPTSLSDIEQAQQELAALATALGSPARGSRAAAVGAAF